MRYYYESQKYKEGIAQGEALVDQMPNDKSLRLALASLYASDARTEDARKQIDFLLARDQTDALLHQVKAQVLEQAGMLPAATEEHRQAVTLNPQNAAYHYALANNLATLSQINDAIFELQQAVALDPRNVRFRIDLANFFYNLQQPLLALPHIEAAIQVDERSAEAHGWLGQIYIGLGRLPDAERELKRAIELSPKDSRIRSTAGMLYLQLNQPRAAEEQFKEANRLNPMQPQPYIGLCMLYRMQNRIPELNMALQALRQIAPPMAQQLEQQLKSWQWMLPQGAIGALLSQWLGAQGTGNQPNPWGR